MNGDGEKSPHGGANEKSLLTGRADNGDLIF